MVGKARPTPEVFSDMRGIHGKRPSPGVVIGVLALAVALSGTAIAGVAAVSNLSKKEKKQVRKIADRRITKRAPKLSVGHADRADVAGNANSLGGVAASSYVQHSELTPVAETNLPLHPGWINIFNPEGPGPGPARAYLDQLGVVHLAGLVARASGTDDVAITLPPGLRPAYDLEFPAVCDTPGLVFDPSPGFAFIYTNGEVRGIPGNTESDCNERLALDGITFRAAG